MASSSSSMSSSSPSSKLLTRTGLPETSHKASRLSMESMPVPVSFICPITHEIMKYPVLTVDGQGYEREAIEQWFRKPGTPTSPLTNTVLNSRELLDNFPLRKAIEEYLQLRPEIQRKEFDRLSLETAAATLQEEMLEKARASQNPQDPTFDFDLHTAAPQAHVAKLFQIITQCNADTINKVDEDGCTALHHAAACGLASICFAILGRDDFTEGARESVNGSAAALAVQNGRIRLASAIYAYLQHEDSEQTAEISIPNSTFPEPVDTRPALQLIEPASQSTGQGETEGETVAVVLDDRMTWWTAKGKSRMQVTSGKGRKGKNDDQPSKGNGERNSKGHGKGKHEMVQQSPLGIRDFLGRWKDSRNNHVEVVEESVHFMASWRSVRTAEVWMEAPIKTSATGISCNEFEVDFSRSKREIICWRDTTGRRENVIWQRL